MVRLRCYGFLYRRFLLPISAVLLTACSGGGGSVGSASIEWLAPSARANGDPLALAEIAGYRIYYGSVAGLYPDVVDINDSTAEGAELDGVPTGTYFVVVTTVDTEGRESDYSAELEIRI